MARMTEEDRDKLTRHVFIQWLASRDLLVEWMDRTLDWHKDRNYAIDELQDRLPSYLIDTFPWADNPEVPWEEFNEQWEEQCGIVLSRLEDGYYGQ